MINIIKGGAEHFIDCKESLKHSVLFDNYFDEKSLNEFIKEGLKKKEIHVAQIIENGEKVNVGFMRIDINGMFSKYPFLRLIAVKKAFRNKNIGKNMLEYFEKIGFENSEKVFLVVSEINQKAKSLYERTGYRETGKIFELYKKNISEFIMMKNRNI
jgi:ribosomal protein S18 acetylase RimI-like enzyme